MPGLSSLQVDIKKQPHNLAWINKEEQSLLKDLGGSGRPGPMGIPAYDDDDYNTDLDEDVAFDNVDISGGMGAGAGAGGGGDTDGGSGGENTSSTATDFIDEPTTAPDNYDPFNTELANIEAGTNPNYTVFDFKDEFEIPDNYSPVGGPGSFDETANEGEIQGPDLNAPTYDAYLDTTFSPVNNVENFDMGPYQDLSWDPKEVSNLEDRGALISYNEKVGLDYFDKSAKQDYEEDVSRAVQLQADYNEKGYNVNVGLMPDGTWSYTGPDSFSVAYDVVNKAFVDAKRSGLFIGLGGFPSAIAFAANKIGQQLGIVEPDKPQSIDQKEGTEIDYTDYRGKSLTGEEIGFEDTSPSVKDKPESSTDLLNSIINYIEKGLFNSQKSPEQEPKHH